MKIDRKRQLESFGKLLDIMDQLREKCPWDRKQTLESLRPQTIEETYELSDAILKGELDNLSKELGDLLLHVVFYAKIGEEKNSFDIADVCERLCNKLIYRHPHVFGSVEVENAEQVKQNWEQLKTKEKDGNKSVLSGVPEGLPSVIKAFRMQEKARAVGFDWVEKKEVWEKVEEELGEFKQALLAQEGSADARQAQKESQGELGDLLFAIINASRLYGLDPDTALESTCAKFRRRFGYLEEQTIKKGKNLKDMTLAQMEEYWEEAKDLEKEGRL
ncbi:MAG: nucleoside triphosphate pyrophosphohydrolase [Bacteroidales bacterium]|nr:nucleoside triphosphate pyrophosphohydrolase [Bacteroidales bacterium]